MNPYNALGVTLESTDHEIRDAYLRLVRAHPPEREPERFHRIQQAYAQIQGEDNRLTHAALGPDPAVQPDSMGEALLDYCRYDDKLAFPDLETFRAALRREVIS